MRAISNVGLAPSESVVLSLMHWEGFTSPARHLSVDRPGVVTGGYGEVGRYADGEVVDRGDAEDRLRLRVGSVGVAVLNAAWTALSQQHADALTHFTYNVGLGSWGPPSVDGFLTSTLLRRLNEGLYWSAALELTRWTHSNGAVVEGLVRRRHYELGWFLGRAPLFDASGVPSIPEHSDAQY